MHAQAFIHINLRTRTCAAHTPETHPPTTMLGFARDKQPGCEVCICHVGEWGIEMARRHRAAVQTDSAKAACPQIITSVFQPLRRLGTSRRLRALPAVVRASEKWAVELNLSFNGRHAGEVSHVRDGQWKEMISSLHCWKEKLEWKEQCSTRET